MVLQSNVADDNLCVESPHEDNSFKSVIYVVICVSLSKCCMWLTVVGS